MKRHQTKAAGYKERALTISLARHIERKIKESLQGVLVFNIYVACEYAGYRGTFVMDVDEIPGIGVDISEKSGSVDI